MADADSCRVTHPQILRGRCPHCKSEIAPGDDEWDLARMKADVEGGDPKTVRLVVRNLQRIEPRLLGALPVYAAILKNTDRMTENIFTTHMALAAGNLPEEEADFLEAEASANPTDLTIRIVLLGFYWLRKRENRKKHVLDVIEHWPRSVIAGEPWAHLDDMRVDAEAAKAIWLRHVEHSPKDTLILGNAASFFTLHDKEISLDLLQRARVIEPEDPEWSNRIALLYTLMSHRGRSPWWSAMALSELERAWGTSGDDRLRLFHLHEMAQMAFDVGQLDKARSYASELLEKTDRTNHGTATFEGNHVLGLIALAEGDVDAARSRLIASGRTTGSPVLSSFGPSFELARRLYAQGERDAILEFFRLCQAFWKHHQEKLNGWIADVERGDPPAKWEHCK